MRANRASCGCVEAWHQVPVPDDTTPEAFLVGHARSPESLRGSGDNPSTQQWWQPRIAFWLRPARSLPRLPLREDDEVDGGAVETLPHAEEAARVPRTVAQRRTDHWLLLRVLWH